MRKQSRLPVYFVLFFALFMLGGFLINLMTDYLWFKEVGFTNRYWTQLLTETASRTTFFLLFFGIMWGNIALALSFIKRELESPSNPEILYVGETRVNVSEWLGKQRPALLITAFISFIIGMPLALNWTQIVSWFHRVPFNTPDPVFGLDVSFYIFTLPILESLYHWAFTLTFITLIGTLVVYIPAILRGATKGRFILTGRPLSHLSALLGVLVLLKSCGYILAGYDLLFSQNRQWFGAFYTDIHAHLLAYQVLTGLTLVLGIILLLNFKLKKVMLPLMGVGIWIAISFILGSIYPAIVQRLVVTPNEYSKEAPYIQHNIKFTTQAYGLENIESKPFAAIHDLSQASLKNNAPTLNNIRLWDYRPLRDTYQQIQVIRQYYKFVDVDIDRYRIGNEYMQVMLSPREIDVPKDARTWTNEKLVYTHGYGVAMTRVNAVEKEGLPKLLIRDIPPVSPSELKIDRPELYFGENQSDYVIVKTQEKEFDYPKGNENVYTTYQGKAGIQIGNSFLKRLMFAWQFGDTDLLFTSRLTPESRLVMSRNIVERCNKIFPFLILDEDPYIAIDQGRLVWILDAYTVTDQFPYSQPVSSRINYIRNAVKITIDAYDGSVNAYISDPTDPLIQTWQKVFPGLFKPLTAIPESLKDNLRYPEFLFTIQAEIFKTYHMTESHILYNQEDKWTFPKETFDDKLQDLDPYYNIMRLPGEPKEQFMMMVPFTPATKTNMIAWMAAKSDYPDYGKLIVYKFPKDRLVYGPQQIEARINQDPAISPQLSLWNQQGSRVLRGNLLVIPIENSILYVEPLYLKSEQSQIPELKRVVVAYDEQIAMESTLEDALAVIFGGKAGLTGGTLQEAPSTDSTDTTAKQKQNINQATSIKDLARQAATHYERAQQKLKAGDWAGYGEEMKLLQNSLRQLERQSQ